MRRTVTRPWAALLVLILFLSANAFAQGANEPWPARTVQIVVPSASGSGFDLLARALAERLASRWGQPVVVTNRPGANSIIGTEFVANAAPDGYTLLLTSDPAITVNPHLYAKLPYDPLRDLVPVAQVSTSHQFLVAHRSLAARTLAELVAVAREHPGKFTYASFGMGSAPHLTGERMKREAGIDLLHVPYRGVPQSVSAVASGEATITFAGVFSALPHVQSGALVPIAFAGERRSPLLPDVPTFIELGYPSLVYTVWYGVFAPAGTPSTLVSLIHRDIAAVIAEPEFRDRELLARGYEPSSLTPAQFREFIVREHAARAELVRRSGARVE